MKKTTQKYSFDKIYSYFREDIGKDSVTDKKNYHIYIYYILERQKLQFFMTYLFGKSTKKFRKLLKYLAKHTLIFSVQESLCSINVCDVPFKTRSCY